MITDILQNLKQRQEFVAWRRGSIERRIRRESNSYILYDIDFERKRVHFYKVDLLDGACRFAAGLTTELTNFKQKLTPWQERNNALIAKRLFYNHKKPAVWEPRFKVIYGGASTEPAERLDDMVATYEAYRWPTFKVVEGGKQ